MWWFMGAALAGGDGYYHPDDIAAASRQFSASSAQMEAPVAALEQALDAQATALNAYREALDLLGPRANSAERARLAALEVAFHRQHAAAQRAVDALVTGFDAAFSASMDRALAGLGMRLTVCAAEVADGRPLPGIRPRMKANPDCVGEGVSARVAASMDNDPALAAALRPLLSDAALTVTPLPVAPQAVVGGGDQWIDLARCAGALARERLLAIDRADDEARDALDATLEQNPAAAGSAEVRAQGEAIAQATAAQRAAVGGPLLAAADKLLAKRTKDGIPPGWCANPALFGGCTGREVTGDWLSPLTTDPAVLRAAK